MGVVEKRHTPSRTVWFDLYPNSLSQTRSFLFNFLAANFLNLNLQFHHHQQHQKNTSNNNHQNHNNDQNLNLDFEVDEYYDYWNNEEMISIECSVLERFLLRIIHLLKIPLFLQYQFLSTCPNKNNIHQNRRKGSREDHDKDQRSLWIEKCEEGRKSLETRRTNQNSLRSFALLRSTHPKFNRNNNNEKNHNNNNENPNSQESCNQFLYLEFDILIAADGTKSSVRQSTLSFPKSVFSFSSEPSSFWWTDKKWWVNYSIPRFEYQPLSTFSLLPTPLPSSSSSFLSPSSSRINADRTKKDKSSSMRQRERERERKVLNESTIVDIPDLRQTAIIVNFKSHFPFSFLPSLLLSSPLPSPFSFPPSPFSLFLLSPLLFCYLSSLCCSGFLQILTLMICSEFDQDSEEVRIIGVIIILVLIVVIDEFRI